MKNLKLIAFAAFASLILAACQGSSNSNPATTTTACTQTSTYNQYGQAVPGCVSPNSYNNGYNNPYGYTNGYNTGYGNTAGYGNTGNPCAVYAQQYGVMYYPSMVNGQMACVASQ